MSRPERIRIAEETVEILRTKTYALDRVTAISIAAALDACLEGTRHYRPENFESIQARVKEKLALRGQGKPVEISIPPTTTFATCKDWVTRLALKNVACLNFASAKNPGGGFLNGSQAQEEALSRASGLYASLLKASGYYESNRKTGTCLYSDHIIWSPSVPVFRDDQDQLLPQPYNVSIITSPAVNAGCIRQNEPQKAAQIRPVMEIRAEKVLTLAVENGVENLVLGAWGCGVFDNSPTEVAEIFAELLRPGRPYSLAFARVAFAIPGFKGSSENLEAFVQVFRK